LTFGTDPNTEDIITLRYIVGSNTDVITGGSGKYACARGQAAFTFDTANNQLRLALAAYIGCN
jgi:hypothetical protein